MRIYNKFKVKNVLFVFSFSGNLVENCGCQKSAFGKLNFPPRKHRLKAEPQNNKVRMNYVL